MVSVALIKEKWCHVGSFLYLIASCRQLEIGASIQTYSILCSVDSPIVVSWRMNVRYISWFACTLGIGLVCALLYVSAEYNDQVHEFENAQMPFDSESWKNWSLLKNGTSAFEPSIRQSMVKDIVTSLLPGAGKKEIEERLGPSPIHEDTKREILVREQKKVRQSDVIHVAGLRKNGFYYDDLGWDLLYEIGICQEEPPIIGGGGDVEFLLVRFDKNNVFQSWYIDGHKWWPQVVGDVGKVSYRRIR